MKKETDRSANGVSEMHSAALSGIAGGAPVHEFKKKPEVPPLKDFRDVPKGGPIEKPPQGGHEERLLPETEYPRDQLGSDIVERAKTDPEAQELLKTPIIPFK